MIVTAGFEMASRKPTRLRDQAFREASFQVPYEVARLSPDAPRFRVEEMAPLSSLRKAWQDIAKTGMHVKSPFNIEKEARVFLYFPKDSDKATAAFLAINAEYVPMDKRRGVVGDSDKRTLLTGVAKATWKCHYMDWVRRHPDIVRRIGPMQLPLIISFRGVVCGCHWNRLVMDFSDPVFLHVMANLVQKDP